VPAQAGDRSTKNLGNAVLLLLLTYLLIALLHQDPSAMGSSRGPMHGLLVIAQLATYTVDPFASHVCN
jgi:hypothetical protein